MISMYLIIYIWRYVLNIHSIKLGQAIFTVMPAATSTEPSVCVFGEKHPTGFSFPKLQAVIESLNLPTEYTDKENVIVGAAPTFKYGFKLSACVCKAVKGKTFLSICPQPGTWLCMVVLGANNKAAQKIFQVREKKKSMITNKESDEWYKYTMIN